MKRRVGALLMALVLVMAGFAAYAEEGQPAELAVEDSVEDASVPEEEPSEGEDAPYFDEEPAAVPEETAAVAEPEAAPETSESAEAVTEAQTTVPEETQGESATEPETTVLAEETGESEEDIETYTALSGNLSVTVEAPKGALPENVLLYMQSVDEESDEYEEVQSYVQESGEEASNLEIADIYFTLDGEKVDPSEAVTVKLGLTEFTNADKASLQAWNYTDRTQGSDIDTGVVEFETTNLQTFAATWNDAQNSNETDALIDNDEEENEDGLASLSVEVSHRSENEDDEFYPAGTEVIFEVVVTNNGEVPLSDIEVTNNLTAASEPIPLLEANGDSETIEIPYTITTYDETAGSVEMDVAATVQYFANYEPDEPDEPKVLNADGIDVLSIKKPEMKVAIDVTNKPEKRKAYKVGDTITYTVTVENTGKVTISDIEVTCSPVDEDDSSGGKWEIASLEPDSKKVSDEFKYTVADDDDLKDSYDDEYAFVTLTANALGHYAQGEDDVVFGEDAENVEVNVKPRNSQKFVDTDGDQVFDDNGEEAMVNHELVYLISYKNNSKETKDIVITDHLEDSLEYGGSTQTHEYDSSTGIVTWTIKDVAPKTEGYVALTAKVVGNGKESVQNRAKVDGTYTNWVSNPIVDDDPTEPTKTVKASNSTKSSSGKELTYTIEYYNHHTDSRTVTITDKLDSSLKYIDKSASDDGNYDDKSKTITWEVNTEPGTDGKVSFTAEFDGGKDEKVENTATVTIEGDNPVKTDPVSYSLGSGDSGTDSGLELDKSVDADGDGEFDDDEEQVNINDTLTYKIICTNNDTETKTVTITDVVDKGLTFDSATEGGAYDEESRTITWEVTVEPSSEEEVFFDATVNNENLKTETIEEQDDIESYIRTGNGEDDGDDDDDGEGGYIEDDIYTSYITVTYKEISNTAVAEIGEDKVESDPVWNYVYSESTSSGSGYGSDSDGEGSGVKSSVNTADDTPVAPMAVLFGTALIVLGADIIYRRRRTQR